MSNCKKCLDLDCLLQVYFSIGMRPAPAHDPPAPSPILTPWCRVVLEKLTGLQLVKKFPAFLWNPKVQYRTHKRPPPVPILGQPNPIHIPTSHLLKIHPNIIYPSTPRSPQWSLSVRFPRQDPIRPPLLTHTRRKQKNVDTNI